MAALEERLEQQRSEAVEQESKEEGTGPPAEAQELDPEAGISFVAKDPNASKGEKPGDEQATRSGVASRRRGARSWRPGASLCSTRCSAGLITRPLMPRSWRELPEKPRASTVQPGESSNPPSSI